MGVAVYWSEFNLQNFDSEARLDKIDITRKGAIVNMGSSAIKTTESHRPNVFALMDRRWGIADGSHLMADEGTSDVSVSRIEDNALLHIQTTESAVLLNPYAGILMLPAGSGHKVNEKRAHARQIPDKKTLGCLRILIYRKRKIGPS
ncbi:hypothetical protein CHS0354_042028 [Potamilus streckersoni]|uniref:Uncharacterized protein n=1 Tax=Potamilus streckersoni TaxID=2493646 RepID=A0AAE0W9V2_9BIVA|nr:hypothetical protein CHS0354_042028 [Potamilus streckersoni]